MRRGGAGAGGLRHTHLLQAHVLLRQLMVALRQRRLLLLQLRDELPRSGRRASLRHPCAPLIVCGCPEEMPEGLSRE